MLLAHVASHAYKCRFDTIDLWVLADNDRAIDTYARAGWQLTAQAKCEDGRRELQMVLTLRSVSDGRHRS